MKTLINSLLILCCLGSPAFAQTPDPPASAAPVNVTSLVDYPRLTLSGTRWWGHARLERNLFVRLLPARPGKPVVFLQELEGIDQQRFFPAGAISAEVAEINGGHAEYSVQVSFDLTQAPASGQYEGKIRLRHGDSEYVVPVSLTVKDPWQPALLIVLIGVALGIWANTYHAQGRPRDELLLKIGQLRRSMQGETAREAAPFSRRIELLLQEMEFDAAGIEAAQARFKDAQEIWKRWRNGREDWIAQFEYQAELEESLKKLPESEYQDKLNQGLRSLNRQVADFAQPVQLRECLRALGKQINAYLPLAAHHEFLRTLPAEHDLRHRFEGLSPFVPNMGMEPAEIETEMEKSVASLKTLLGEINQARQAGGTKSVGPFDFSPGGHEIAIDSQPGLPPEVRALGELQAESIAAKTRLQWFAWFSYATAVIFLAGAGFEQLYTVNQTFGANPVNDYLGLLAWGFAAEASRASVTKLIKEWRPRG